MGRLATMLLITLSTPAGAQNLSLGDLIIDRPAVDILGFELQLVGQPGTPGYNTIATLEFRVAGSGEWVRGPDMMRVRPDLGTDMLRVEAFAGAIWDLFPGTVYDVRITVTEPQVGSQVVTTTVRTRRLAPETRHRPADHVVDAASSPTQQEIQSILDEVTAGDIIEVRGTHLVDNLELRARGTAENPIYLRGDGTGVLQDPRGSEIITVLGDHWVVEDLSIMSEMESHRWVIRVDGRRLGADSERAPVTGFTMRRCLVSGRRAIRAWEGEDSEIYDVTLYDNVFVGNWSWSDIVTLVDGGTVQGVTGISNTWDDTGAKMTGQGHSVFNNNFSGYGDAIKTDRETSIINTTISYSRNKIFWGGDDGIELDDAFRNVVMIDNLIMNTGTGGSKQPNFVTGGPAYMVRNVLVNQFLRPFKLNDGPNGVQILHNTVVQAKDHFWIQHDNGRVENLDVLNNLFVHVNHQPGTGMIIFNADLEGEQWDGNAYWPDGYFEYNYFGLADGFKDASGNSRFPKGYRGARYEISGVLLKTQPFSAGLSAFGSDWRSRVTDFDPRILESSSASSEDISLPSFVGKARGAVDINVSPPHYGARIGATLPSPPSDLTVE